MSSPVRGIVVAHGDLAAALVGAVEKIGGVEGALTSISNDGLGAEALRARVSAEIDSHAAIVFVDLMAGSCAMAGLGLAREADDVAVLTGVNVPMLLDFVFNQDTPVKELAVRLVGKARVGIVAHGCSADQPASF